jgi:hypothetical protein
LCLAQGFLKFGGQFFNSHKNLRLALTLGPLGIFQVQEHFAGLTRIKQ